MHFGLIAQDTEDKLKEFDAANSGIIDYDKATDRYGIRYTELISPIIKAVQELYVEMKKGLAKNDQEIADLRKENDELKARLEALERAVQK